MQNSPLQLESYYLTSVHLDCDDSVPVTEMPGMELSSTVGLGMHKNDTRRFKVSLTVAFKPVLESTVGYKGTISFTGYFAVAPTYPEEKVKLLVQTNGPSVLYSAVRETCANLTARGPWPLFILPTQTFHSPPKSEIAEEKKPERVSPA